MRTEYQEQAKVFKALCDPKRLSILEQLRSGEKCACVCWKVTATTTPVRKLMCRKVTQENLIDISLLFRENLQNGIDRLRNAAYTKSYQNNLI